MSLTAEGTSVLYVKRFADYLRWETSTDISSSTKVRFRATGVGKGLG